MVDENSNKLVLAASTYIQNERFGTCCELYSKVGDFIMFPLVWICLELTDILNIMVTLESVIGLVCGSS